MTNRWKLINIQVPGSCFGDGKHSFELKEDVHFCPNCGMTVQIDSEFNETTINKLLKMSPKNHA